MRIFAVVAVGLLCSVFGATLSQILHSGSDYIEKDHALKRGPLRDISQNALLIILILSNIASGIMQLCYYNNSLLIVCKLIVLATSLWICAWFDWKYELIPNKVVFCTLILRIPILLAEIMLQPENILYYAITYLAAAVGMLVISILCRVIVPQSLGFGDIKLMTVMGLFLGVDAMWNVMLCAMILSFFVGVVLILSKTASGKEEIPFAPFIAVGMTIAGFLVRL